MEGNEKEEMECLIHTDEVHGEVLKFKDNTWGKVKEAATTRLKTWKQSNYSDMCESLPDTFDENRHGYHLICYRKFTSVPKLEGRDPPQAKSILLRSSVSPDLKLASTSGVFEKKCIFCEKRKRIKGREEALGNCETLEAERLIKVAATALQDDPMLVKIKDIDFVAKEVRYHHSCRRQYLDRAKSRQLLGESAARKNDTRNKTSHNQQKHDSAFKKQQTTFRLTLLMPKKHSFCTQFMQDIVPISLRKAFIVLHILLRSFMKNY